MNQRRYAEIVRGFAGRSVVVLGDLMMDEYLWGRATRISPESPVMVVEVDRESRVPGGAANVVNNLLALGAAVSVVGTVGKDEIGAQLIAALRDEGADVSGIVADSSRPTTRKTRIVAHNQQVLRVDREQTHAVDDATQVAICRQLQSALRRANAVLVSDYDKGVLTSSVAHLAVLGAKDAGKPLTANPKPPNAWHLSGASVISLNQSEAEKLIGHSLGDDALPEAGARLRQQLEAETLVVTRGAKGLSLWTAAEAAQHVPAHPVEVYDVAGAGDTVISTLTLAILVGASMGEAAEVANHAAACVVRKLGVATVSADELIADRGRERNL